ncbi:MAG: TlpA family protein disulfide reductase [Candidatus Promineifilaceae bacterium]
MNNAILKKVYGIWPRFFIMKNIQLLAFLLPMALMVAACTTANEPTSDIVAPSPLQIMFASDDYYVGTPRITLVMFDGAKPATGLQDVTVTLYDISEETPQEVWSGEATEYADAPVPYWTIFPEIPTAGDWGLAIDAITAEGTPDNYQRSIPVADAPRSPAVGTVPPASVNRTIETHDVAVLSSGNDPNPDLYDQTVADALQSGKPSVITFATPAFCATQVCAPVVDTVESVYAEIGEAANFIHLEIYDDFQELTTAAEVAEWGLTSEPWTFVLNAEGEVAARMGGPVSVAEIMEALEPLLP